MIIEQHAAAIIKEVFRGLVLQLCRRRRLRFRLHSASAALLIVFKQPLMIVSSSLPLLY